MANNYPIIDGLGVSKTFKSTETGGVHVVHHNIDSINTNAVSTLNSTATLLNAAAVFTGTAEDVTRYDSVVVAVKTDQNGTFSVQFSNDGTNWDSVLTRYYRTNQIEAPHRFTIARRYVRVVFTNTSASNQTYLRLQTVFGTKTALNAPTDATLAQDYDAIVVRPTEYKTEVGLSRRQGATAWSKFGYNDDVDTGTEVIAAFGGTFNPMLTARTLSVVSSSANDTVDGTGARTITITGVDANYVAQTEIVTMNGTTPVVPDATWLGVNRISLTTAGNGLVNAGAITATATTDSTVQASIPAGEGSTQQMIFFTQADHQSLVEWLTFSVVRFGSATEPKLTIRGWLYSVVTGTKQEVFRQYIDSAASDHLELFTPIPFRFGEKSCFWLECTTDRDNTRIAGRFSLIEHRDVDA